MTDMLDRLQAMPKTEATEAMSLPGATQVISPRRLPFELSDAGRVLLAALSAAAGVIHLVMVPSHMAESGVEVDADTCAALGGSLMAKTQWMMHVWSVPGYEVPQASGGVFAEANPKIKCADGTYYIMDVSQMPQHQTNVCRSELN